MRTSCGGWRPPRLWPAVRARTRTLARGPGWRDVGPAPGRAWWRGEARQNASVEEAAKPDAAPPGGSPALAAAGVSGPAPRGGAGPGRRDLSARTPLGHVRTRVRAVIRGTGR